MFGNNLNQFGFGFFARTVGLNGDGGRTSNADSIRKLNLTLVCKTGCNQILCNITRSVGSRTVNFGTILSGKCTAAVASISAVSIYDNLTTGEPAVAVRTTDYETTGRVDKELGGVADKFFRKNRIKNIFFNIFM